MAKAPTTYRNHIPLPAINLQFSRTLTRTSIHHKRQVSGPYTTLFTYALSYQVVFLPKTPQELPYNLINQMPVAKSEKQQVVIEVQDVSPPGGKSLMGEYQIGKAMKPQTPECP